MAGITWDRDAAAHLLARMGLPGPPGAVDDLLGRGLEDAVDSLLRFELVDNGALEQHLLELAIDTSTPQGIVQEWVVRFVETARPFEERMALFWHMHFATGIGKVRVPELMRRQVQTFRQSGRSRLDDLLLAVSRDPAMLIWLDNIYNHADAPNENYARELMELFSMGLNTYTQEDVVAAARAFTGWTLQRTATSVEFVFLPWDHDFGSKTFLGETGPWDGTDIIRIICEQEVTPRFIAGKMWSHFAAGEAPASLVDRMAAAYFAEDHSLETMFRTLFTSEEFFAPEQRRARPKGPVEFTCGLLRQLEASTDGTALGGFIAGQGQALYNAPDPSGWDEGMAWISTTSLLLRSQLASVVGFGAGGPVELDLPRMLSDAGVSTADEAVDRLSVQLDLPSPDEERRTALAAYLTTNPYTGGPLPFDLGSDATRFKLAGLIQVLTTDPAYQLA